MYTINKPLHLSPYDHPDIYPGPAPEKSYLYYNQVFSIEGSLFRYPDIPATNTMAIQVWQAHMLMFISSFFRMEKKHFIQKVKTSERFREKVLKALKRFSKSVKWDDWQRVDTVLKWKESQILE